MSQLPAEWYVYVDDNAHEWAVRLPREVGRHPAFGFRPLNGPQLPVLQNGRNPIRYTRVSGLRPRHVVLTRQTGPYSQQRKTLPVGTRDAFSTMPSTLVLSDSDGLPVEWECRPIAGESATFSRLPQSAPWSASAD